MKKLAILLLSILAIFIVVVYLSVAETEDEFRTCEIIGVEDIDKIDFKDFDSVTVAASTLYEASLLKEIIQGKQYRDAWAARITVPIAFLDTLKGGLKVIEEGGGKQTHSLEMEDSLGIRYTLRSLSKNPEKLIPDLAKDLGVENIVVDGISAQHPYAALVVAALSDAANILHTHPKLMFIPKQEGLGEFNEKFGNRLFLFEYESEGKVDWTGLAGVSEILDTKDLLELKSQFGKGLQIDKNALIKARLFDLIIGDWDRHEKQWGWAMQKTSDGLIAKPVAADRDNAFFHLEGILPNLIANDITLPEIQTFEIEIDYLQGLVSSFDEYFLRNASKEQFTAVAMKLRNELTNEVINRSFKNWPKKIDALDGSQIREKIFTRRDAIITYAENFYKILNARPRTEIILNGMEKLELTDTLMECFDCYE